MTPSGACGGAISGVDHIGRATVEDRGVWDDAADLGNSAAYDELLRAGGSDLGGLGSDIRGIDNVPTGGHQEGNRICLDLPYGDSDIGNIQWDDGGDDRGDVHDGIARADK